MRHSLLIAILPVVIAAGAHAKDAPKSVVVDCAKRQSLNAAIEDGAETLVIEFSGVCAEDVMIRRGHVTLRGSAPGAKIAGAASAAAPEWGVTIRGVSNVLLSNFAVQDGDRGGIKLLSAAAVTLDGIVSNGNAGDGLRLLEGSAAFVRNSSFDDNGEGIGVWQNSSVVFEGSVTMNGNGRAGLLLSGSSEASVSFFGAQVSANGNAQYGYILQLGAIAQMAAANPTSVAANGNVVCGAILLSESAWGGRLSVQNSPVGVDLTASSFESSALSVSGCTTGVFAHLGSYVTLRVPAISGNQVGLWLDGAAAQINNAVLQGNSNTDVRLQFGTRASFNAASSAATVTCDGTVLVRGPVTCPPAALAFARSGGEQEKEELTWVAAVQELKD
jgi:hypothetical protein